MATIFSPSFAKQAVSGARLFATTIERGPFAGFCARAAETAKPSQRLVNQIAWAAIEYAAREKHYASPEDVINAAAEKVTALRTPMFDSSIRQEAFAQAAAKIDGDSINAAIKEDAKGFLESVKTRAALKEHGLTFGRT